MANNKKGRRQKGKKKKPRSLKSWTENRKKHKAMGGKKNQEHGQRKHHENRTDVGKQTNQQSEGTTQA